MMKILEHLYGGNLEVSGLNCSEIMELLDMLRYLLLQESFKILEQYLDNEIEAKKIPVKDCLDAAEMTFSLKLVNARFSIIDYITRNIDIVIRDHSEVISNLSKEVVGMIISSSSFQELDQINHLKFVEKWFHTSGLKTSRRKKYLFWFKLSKFTVDDLLGYVRNSKLFHDEDIFEAVKKVHNKLEDRNKKLIQKLKSENNPLFDLILSSSDFDS